MSQNPGTQTVIQMEMGKDEGEDCGHEKKNLRRNIKSLAVSKLATQSCPAMSRTLLVPATTTSSLFPGEQLPHSSKKLFPLSQQFSSASPHSVPFSVPVTAGWHPDTGGIWMFGRDSSFCGYPASLCIPQPAWSAGCPGGITVNCFLTGFRAG